MIEAVQKLMLFEFSISYLIEHRQAEQLESALKKTLKLLNDRGILWRIIKAFLLTSFTVTVPGLKLYCNCKCKMKHKRSIS